MDVNRYWRPLFTVTAICSTVTQNWKKLWFGFTSTPTLKNSTKWNAGAYWRKQLHLHTHQVGPSNENISNLVYYFFIGKFYGVFITLKFRWFIVCLDFGLVFDPFKWISAENFFIGLYVLVKCQSKYIINTVYVIDNLISS